MSDEARLAASMACTETVFAFFHCLDERTHELAVSLFAPDGVWHRNGEALRGRESIGRALAARPETRRTFHAVCNPLVSRVDRTHAEVRFFLMAFEAQRTDASDTPPLTPSAVRRCIDTLVFDGERWLIASKSSERHLPFI
ncbi:nuclear transport factor 2 family protein [Caballeronia sp. LZ065]|uniref:nuclear transport factor 2 family protein n=1 Tax=Caballeronia sp. LZ065 TaxID=3038571 RepID=UPI00285CDFB2|nr:nuclear transport factor 2 family protein [Caballeronia sp. LZ065]MDR5782930.1 nuclear transport factor 2 family protein [Caballeronia sp. LZ065]